MASNQAVVQSRNSFPTTIQGAIGEVVLECIITQWHWSSCTKIKTLSSIENSHSTGVMFESFSGS